MHQTNRYRKLRKIGEKWMVMLEPSDYEGHEEELKDNDIIEVPEINILPESLKSLIMLNQKKARE